MRKVSVVIPIRTKRRILNPYLEQLETALKRYRLMSLIPKLNEWPPN